MTSMKSSNLNEKSYNKISKLFVSRRKTISGELVTFSKLLLPHSHVLDIGCGGGVPNASYLTTCGFQITGIDIASAMIEQAKENVPSGHFMKLGIMDFDSNEQFGGILAWDSLFHLQLNEHEAAFSKIFHLLEPGGYFLFTHGCSEGNLQGQIYGETFRYSSPGPDKIRRILSALHFEILDWKADYTDSTDEKGYIRVLCRKSGGRRKHSVYLWISKLFRFVR